MSQDTFPKPPTDNRPEDDTTMNRRVVRARDTDIEESEQIARWFQEALRLGYDFVYHEARPLENTKRMMLVAKGFDSSNIFKVVLDEETPK